MIDTKEHPHFVFIDESGVLQNDPNQPLFAVGLLAIDKTSRLHQALQKVRCQAIASCRNARGFEFKFSSATLNNLAYYKKLIDVALNQHEIKVSVSVLDKTNQPKAGEWYRGSTWESYLAHTIELVRRAVEINAL